MITIDLSERENKTKTDYIYQFIKDAILKGELQKGEKLPSKREFAEHNGISVLTVENAYGMLEEEGYIYSKPRSGFYVSKLNKTTGKGGLDNEIVLLPEEMPTLSEKPEPELARYIRKVLSEKPWVTHMQPDGAGCAVLRNAIAKHLYRYRNMIVNPEKIIIGPGAEMIYGFLVLLLGSDKCFGVEYPSYEKIELAYRAYGAETERLKMGKDGVTSTALKNSSADILHVSPYHSYPTGITAPAGKRFEYLLWAQKRDAYIVEDDFDSEFAFFRKPIDTLFSMDSEERVIYLNTFAKSISPAIRIAYLILPGKLMEKYKSNLGFFSCPVPVLDQYVLAEFINAGAFERHLSRLHHLHK